MTDAVTANLKVRGKSATDIEFNFAVALEYYGLDYLFQVDYWGGRRLRGGLVLDFLVFTVPMPTPVFINGAYWHKGKRTGIDEIQTILLNSVYGGAIMPVIELWPQDVETVDAAKSTVRRLLL